VSTTTTTISPLCGNGQVNAGESCDDGNNNNNDTCPADCTIDPCTPVSANQLADVFFQPPAGANVAGLTVLVDYPEGRVQIPGSGSVQSSISMLPSGAFGSSNDLNHALREVVGAGNAIPPGRLFRVTFQSCQGAPAATAGNYSCVVIEASDPFTNPVSGVTCSVTVP
jgi:cysteine-rich repeat protein